MIVVGTEKIKGSLEIGLTFQVEANKEYNLTDEEYYNPKVQMAIKTFGFLKVKNSSTTKTKIVNGEPVEDNEDRFVSCKNNYNRELTFKHFDFPIKPGAEFKIKESQLADSAFQSALSKKMITVIGKIGTEDGAEPDITDVDISGEIAEYQKESIVEERIEANENLPSKFSTLTAIYEEELDQNEEITVSNVVNDPEPEPILSSDIPDPKQRSIAWDPAGDGINTNTMKDGKVWDSKTQTLVGKDNLPEGAGGPAKDEISFVDKEQEEERIEQHPNLDKEKALKQTDDDLSFVDKEQQEAKEREAASREKKAKQLAIDTLVKEARKSDASVEKKAIKKPRKKRSKGKKKIAKKDKEEGQTTQDSQDIKKDEQ